MHGQPSPQPLPGLIKWSGPVRWEALLAGPLAPLARALAESIAERRWFGAKAVAVQRVVPRELFLLAEDTCWVIAEIELVDGARQFYQLPLAIAWSPASGGQMPPREAIWAHLEIADGTRGVVYDPLAQGAVASRVLELFDSGADLAGIQGRLVAGRTTMYDALRGSRTVSLPAEAVRAEQSNTSLVFGGRLILKLFRRIEPGINPDLEMTAHLTERGFAAAAPLAGKLEYVRPGEAPWSLAVLQAFVPNQGDAWQDALARLSRLVAGPAPGMPAATSLIRAPQSSLVAVARQAVPAAVETALGDSLSWSARLGQRTAELHLALCDDRDAPDFAPEPFRPQDLQAQCDRARQMAAATLASVKASGSEAALFGVDLSRLAPVIDKHLAEAADARVQVDKMRVHGDFHLGQVLVRGQDFVIIDFEGEPARPLAERRQKQLALRDVAGMLRSFHYAAGFAARQTMAGGGQATSVKQACQSWCYWSSVAFLSAYLRAAGRARFLPRDGASLQRLLDLCLLEKAIYELWYELNNRPEWVDLPLGALVEMAQPGTG